MLRYRMNVFLIAAITADGFISSGTTQRSFDWTSSEDKRFYVDKIKEAGVVVIGATTFKTFNKFPKGLTYFVYTNNSKEFVNPKPHVITAKPTQSGPKELLAELEREGHHTLAICGGASIYTMFLKAGVINKLYLTVEPVLFGNGIKLLSDELHTKLKLVDVKKLNTDTMLLEYDVVPRG